MPAVSSSNDYQRFRNARRQASKKLSTRVDNFQGEQVIKTIRNSDRVAKSIARDRFGYEPKVYRRVCHVCGKVIKHMGMGDHVNSTHIRHMFLYGRSRKPIDSAVRVGPFEVTVYAPPRSRRLKGVRVWHSESDTGCEAASKGTVEANMKDAVKKMRKHLNRWAAYKMELDK